MRDAFGVERPDLVSKGLRRAKDEYDGRRMDRAVGREYGKAEKLRNKSEKHWDKSATMNMNRSVKHTRKALKLRAKADQHTQRGQGLGLARTAHAKAKRIGPYADEA